MPSQVTSQAKPSDSSDSKARVAFNIDRGIVAKGMTNRALAEAIIRRGYPGRVSEHQVWRWRRGRHMPSTAALIVMAEVLFGGDVLELYAEPTA